jgi:hypothetical protein
MKYFVGDTKSPYIVQVWEPVAYAKQNCKMKPFILFGKVCCDFSFLDCCYINILNASEFCTCFVSILKIRI